MDHPTSTPVVLHLEEIYRTPDGHHRTQGRAEKYKNRRAPDDLIYVYVRDRIREGAMIFVNAFIGKSKLSKFSKTPHQHGSNTPTWSPRIAAPRREHEVHRPNSKISETSGMMPAGEEGGRRAGNANARRADLVRLEVDLVAEEEHDAGLVERAGERGGLGAGPRGAGVLAGAQELRVLDDLAVPEAPLERLDVREPHQTPRLLRRHLRLRVPPRLRRRRQRREAEPLEGARRGKPACDDGPRARGGGGGGAEDGAGESPH